MAARKALDILRQGAEAWNQYRRGHDFSPESFGLSGADLGKASLAKANLSLMDLSGANLSGADLGGADLSGAKLSAADLTAANLGAAYLFEANLSGAHLSGAHLGGADLGKANLGKANLSLMDLSGVNLSGAELGGANLSGANLGGVTLAKANLGGANLYGANLGGVNLAGASLTGADLGGADLGAANLSGADLSDASLVDANLSGADLTDAIVKSSNFSLANLSDADTSGIRFDRRTMRGKYRGTRGLDSCYGNALFKRVASDQDYLDSLESHWEGTWRARLFWAWGLIDYGRSLSRVVAIAFALMLFYGCVYSLWPELLGLDCKPGGPACGVGHQVPHSLFTPFYFSIVTFTTLGFGDIAPKTTLGEIVVSTEVLIGYTMLGLLLSVLAEKVARRS